MSTTAELRALAEGARQLATTLTRAEDRRLALQYAAELEAKVALREKSEPFPRAPELTVGERRSHYDRRVKLLAERIGDERDEAAPMPKWQPPPP
jgi:hypothetical protein